MHVSLHRARCANWLAYERVLAVHRVIAGVLAMNASNHKLTFDLQTSKPLILAALLFAVLCGTGAVLYTAAQDAQPDTLSAPQGQAPEPDTLYAPPGKSPEPNTPYPPQGQSSEPDTLYAPPEESPAQFQDQWSLGVRFESTRVGARLTDVVLGGAADRTGLQAGDLIVAVDDLGWGRWVDD